MKIVCFVGREHHALKMNTALEVLKKRGHEVLHVISDNAINQDPSSAFIRKYSDNWAHAYDYLTEDSAKEINAIANDIQHFSTNKDLLKYISPYWITFSIREAAENIVAFRNLINREEPNAVILLHSNNFWARILLYLAQEQNIKTFAFQEGLLRQRDQETMGKQASSAKFVDRLFTWSESDKKAYLDAGVDESVVNPVGPSHLDYAIRMKKSPEWEQKKPALKAQMGYRQGRILSFMPPISNHYKGNLQEGIRTLNSFAANSGFNFYVRLHPFEHRLRDALQNAMPDIYFDRNADSVPLLICSDAVVTQHSTIGIEALFLNTPLFEIDMNNMGIEQSLESKGVPVIRSTDDLLMIREGREYNQQLREWVESTFSLVDGRSSERIADAVEETVWYE